MRSALECIVVSRASYNSTQDLHGIESPGWRILPFAAFQLELNALFLLLFCVLRLGLRSRLLSLYPFSALGPGFRSWLAHPTPFLGFWTAIDLFYHQLSWILRLRVARWWDFLASESKRAFSNNIYPIPHIRSTCLPTIYHPTASIPLEKLINRHWTRITGFSWSELTKQA